MVLTSSQKAFALPAGLAFAAVSDRALERAAQVEHRGYYFDFLQLEKYLKRNQTPATPAISLMYALDRQLEDMLREGMENRFARHRAHARQRLLQLLRSERHSFTHLHRSGVVIDTKGDQRHTGLFTAISTTKPYIVLFT